MTKTKCVVAMRAIRRIEAAVDSSARSEGLRSFIHHDVLRAVADAPDGKLRSVEIERLLGIPQYTTSRVAKKLVSEGLLLRVACEDDRRGQAVRVTDLGVGLLDRVETACELMLNSLGPDEALRPHVSTIANRAYGLLQTTKADERRIKGAVRANGRARR